MGVELWEAVEQAPAAEVEHPYDAQQVEEGSSLAAVPVLREICESDLRLILSALGGPAEVFAASVMSTFSWTRFCVLCSPFSTATETKLRQQSAE
jgi:hypothetical protein